MLLERRMALAKCWVSCCGHVKCCHCLALWLVFIRPLYASQDGEYDKDGCEFEEDEDMAEAEAEEATVQVAAPAAAAAAPPAKVRVTLPEGFPARCQ